MDIAKLDLSPSVYKALRRAEIDAINAAHAFGGDHDPIMTEARMKYLRTIPYEQLTPGEMRYWVDEPAAAQE